jgi:hypothetical protein
MDAFEQAFRLGFGGADSAESQATAELVALGDASGLLMQTAALVGEPVPADLLDAPPMPAAWPVSLASAVRDANSDRWELARTMASVLLGVVGHRPDISTGFERGLFGLGFMVIMHNQPIAGEAAPFIIDWLMNM